MEKILEGIGIERKSDVLQLYNGSPMLQVLVARYPQVAIEVLKYSLEKGWKYLWVYHASAMEATFRGGKSINQPWVVLHKVTL